MDYKDYYKTLSVDKSASDADIKKQYRRLARKYHPDVSKEANAEAKFKEVQEAYEVLKDKEKRATYDRFGSAGPQGFEPPPGHRGQQHAGGFHSSGAGDFSDFFESLFGGGGNRAGSAHGHFQQRGEDQESNISITLEQAFHGAEITLQLQDTIRNPRTGQPERNVRDIKVRIPKGITDGQKIRLIKQGSAGQGGGANGDLLLKVSVKPDKRYQIEGKNLTITLPITPWEAALGATVEVPTLAGTVKLKIPAGSQSGNKMRLKGRGLPAKAAGDQLVILSIHTPKPTSDAQKALYEKMAVEMQFNPRA